MDQERDGANDSNVDVLEHIQNVIAQVCMVDRETVTAKGRLLGFGIDSIRLFELMMCIEEDFEIQMEPERLADIKTVGQLAEYVKTLRIEAYRDGKY